MGGRGREKRRTQTNDDAKEKRVVAAVTTTRKGSQFPGWGWEEVATLVIFFILFLPPTLPFCFHWFIFFLFFIFFLLLLSFCLPPSPCKGIKSTLFPSLLKKREEENLIGATVLFIFVFSFLSRQRLFCFFFFLRTHLLPSAFRLSFRTSFLSFTLFTSLLEDNWKDLFYLVNLLVLCLILRFVNSFEVLYPILREFRKVILCSRISCLITKQRHLNWSNSAVTQSIFINNLM